MGNVAEIYIAEQANGALIKMTTVVAEAGKGIAGDRYYSETGTFSNKLAELPDKEITLIEAEEVDHFNQINNFQIPYSDFRRNIITRGIRLNNLVGTTFAVGDVLLKGLRFCEPCAYLAKVLVPEVLPGLVGRAGLRAQIIATGNINVGDQIAMDSLL